MKMTTGAAATLFSALRGLQTDPRPQPARFGLAVAVNAKRLQDVAEAFQDSRMALISQHAVIDASGQPVIEDGRYKIEDEAAFASAFQGIETAEVELSLMMIEIDHLPEMIEPTIVQYLMPMINVGV